MTPKTPSDPAAAETIPLEEGDPGETVHLQVKPGGTARLGDKAFGDRATIQVRRRDRGQVTGPVQEVDPNAVPDVGAITAAA